MTDHLGFTNRFEGTNDARHQDAGGPSRRPSSALDLRLGAGLSLYYVLTPATPDLLGARSRNYGIDVPAPAGRPLEGRTVTLDAGHNGGNAAHPEIVNRTVYAGGGRYKPCNTVGTSTARGYPEHAFTWDVSRRAAALLRAQGAEIVFTRPGDAGAGPCIDVRAAIANRAGSDAVVSVHADGSTQVGARGFHVIAPMSPPVAAGVAARSDRLARQLRAAFRATTGIPYANYIAGGDGLDTRRDLGGLNLSTRPVVFLECGNMRNGQDAALMTSAAGRQRIAAGIARGIADHLRR
jgi:N-acetylmuramoyl-L-alanine amidase